MLTAKNYVHVHNIQNIEITTTHLFKFQVSFSSDQVNRQHQKQVETSKTERNFSFRVVARTE